MGLARFNIHGFIKEIRPSYTSPTSERETRIVLIETSDSETFAILFGGKILSVCDKLKVNDRVNCEGKLLCDRQMRLSPPKNAAILIASFLTVLE